MSVIKFNENAFKAYQQTFQARYGKTGGILISGTEGIPPVKCTPLGDPIIDQLLSGDTQTGGMIDGGFVELVGGNSSGKTTLALEFLVSYYHSQPDRAIAFIDVEGAFDSRYAEHLGVPIKDSRFIFARPINGKEALTLVEDLVKTGMFSCIVLDSWAALQPPVSDKKGRETGDNKIGAHAAMTSDSLREIKPYLKPNNTTLIALNQQRVNITPMGAFGKKSTGGEALPFYADLRLKIERPDQKKDFRKITVIKSKMQAIPQDSCMIKITHGLGLDRFNSYLEQAMVRNLVNKRGGGNYEFDLPSGPISVRGEANLLPYFEENQDTYKEFLEVLNVPFSPLRTKMFKRELDDVHEQEGLDLDLDYDE